MRIFNAVCCALGVLAFVLVFGGIACALVLGLSAMAQLKLPVSGELALSIWVLALLSAIGILTKIGRQYR